MIPSPQKLQRMSPDETVLAMAKGITTSPDWVDTLKEADLLDYISIGGVRTPFFMGIRLTVEPGS